VLGIAIDLLTQRLAALRTSRASDRGAGPNA
jgi:hypothetical protein